MMTWRKRHFAALASLLCVVTSNGHAAAPSDPVALRIEDFDQALLSAMKLAQGRADALLPAVEQTFNFSVMAQFLVGVPWAELPASDHAALIAALKRYTAVRLAYRFDRFANQKFIIDPVVKERGPDRLVKTQFLTPGDAPVHIDYRMREYDGSWKVIDVYSDGVSLLTTQRADVLSTLEAGGTAALVTKLQQAADQLR
jgi:hopanoid biosynthesis associated membrane protein HpnM